MPSFSFDNFNREGYCQREREIGFPHIHVIRPTSDSNKFVGFDASLAFTSHKADWWMTCAARCCWEDLNDTNNIIRE